MSVRAAARRVSRRATMARGKGGGALAAFRAGLAGLLACCAVGAGVAETSPVLVQSAPGRFEIAAPEAGIAHAIVAEAEEAWRWLAGPLGLPPAFSSPVFVRVMSQSAAAPAVSVEPGGIVSVRLPSINLSEHELRRALIRGLLLRLAVAHHGAEARHVVPLWLEQGCIGWWETRANPAQLDAAKHESARIAPPPLGALLGWERGTAEPRRLVVAALWWFTFLQTEPGPNGGWSAFLPRILGGEDPVRALAATYATTLQDGADRELWWQTGWHHVRRARTLPGFEAAESREKILALTRFVFAGADPDTDVVLPLRDVLARAGEPIVGAELARRASELGRELALLHPFYRNAGLSLAEALAARNRTAAERTAASEAFARDWQHATQLEAATSAALDHIEATRIRTR